MVYLNVDLPYMLEDFFSFFRIDKIYDGPYIVTDNLGFQKDNFTYEQEAPYGFQR